MTTPLNRTSAAEQTAACGLPDLVRPQFFPGQRLTDRDLTAVVEWARARFRLDHLHGSWGVVCGLSVTAHVAAPGRPPAATVAPGFAVDAGGTPLVVREPLTAALPRVTGKTIGKRNPVKLTVGPYEIDVNSNWAVFDLVLCPEESVAESAAVGCGPEDRTCKTTRTSEGVALKWERREWGRVVGPVTDGESTDPGYQLLVRFQAATKVRQQVFDGSIAPTAEEAGVIWTWVQGEFHGRAFSSRGFPDLYGWLEKNGAAELMTSRLGEVLFWMADAARQASAACPKPSPDCDEVGVPIARVWAEIDGSDSAVRFLDTAPPARRPFGPDDDGPNLLRYVGMPWGVARAALARAGVTARSEQFAPTSGSALLEVYKSEGQLVPGEPVVALVLKATGTTSQPLADRVIGFRADPRTPVVDAAPTPPPPATPPPTPPPPATPPPTPPPPATPPPTPPPPPPPPVPPLPIPPPPM